MDLDFIISDGQGNYYHLTDEIIKSRKIVKKQTISALNELRAGKADSFAVLTGGPAADRGVAAADPRRTQKLMDLGNGVQVVTLSKALGITIC